MTKLLIAFIPVILIAISGFIAIAWSRKDKKAKPEPGPKPAVNEMSYDDLKAVRKYLIRNREWMVKQMRNYPLVVEGCGHIQYYNCFANRADINQAIRELTKTIKKADDSLPTEFAQNVHEIMNKGKTVNKPKAKKRRNR